MLKKMINVNQDHVMIKLTGRLYMEEATGLRVDLLRLFESGHKNFVVDLSDLENMDTTGLGVFISLYKRTKTSGGHISMQGMNSSVNELFTLTGMNQIFC